MRTICCVVQNVYDFDPRVRRKAEALVDAGYVVDVLALRPSPVGQEPVKKRYVLNGVNVYTISLGKKRGSLARYLFEYIAFFLWVFVRTPLLMRQRQYAVIDVNTLPDFLIFAPAVARWMGARLVLDMHEITPEFYMSKYGIEENSWVVRVMKFLEKLSFNFADHVITINEPIQELLARRGLALSKSTVIMNTVDEGRFSSTNSPSALPRRQQESLIMMYHGTLTRIYGLDIAIEAFALTHQEMPGAELWILGPGSEKDQLTNLAQVRGLGSKVKVHGQVRAEEIPAWLNQCDVGILPIRRDIFLDFAFPNKLSEYIVMGKAVIVSRLKSLQHYFTEDALAFFTPNDPVDLSRQMVRLYHDRQWQARLALRAKEEYAPIRWDVMRERYLGLMDHLVATQAHAANPVLPTPSTASPQGKVIVRKLGLRE
jgi:glycosyltransferase involved in cell wall biosynthesis